MWGGFERHFSNGGSRAPFYFVTAACYSTAYFLFSLQMTDYVNEWSSFFIFEKLSGKKNVP